MLISAFPNTPISLGLVCDFVSRYSPFDKFKFGHMAVTLRYQLQSQSHLVAGIDDRIVGYLGWIRTKRAIAETWMLEQGPLTAVEEGVDAIAVTILVTENLNSGAAPKITTSEIRAPEPTFDRKPEITSFNEKLRPADVFGTMALPLVERMKSINAGITLYYWKRHFPDGRAEVKRSISR